MDEAVSATPTSVPKSAAEATKAAPAAAGRSRAGAGRGCGLAALPHRLRAPHRCSSGPTIRCCCSANSAARLTQRRIAQSAVPALADFDPEAVYCAGPSSWRRRRDRGRRRSLRVRQGDCDLAIVDLAAGADRQCRRPRRRFSAVTAEQPVQSEVAAAGRGGGDARRRRRPRPRPTVAPPTAAKIASAAKDGAAAAPPRSVDPRRSRQARPRRQHGGRTRHHPVHADRADGRRCRPTSSEPVARHRSAGADDARPAGRRHGDPRPAGQIGVQRMPRLVRELAAADRQEGPPRHPTARRPRSTRP